MGPELTPWECVRNIVGFLWLIALFFPPAMLDGGEVVSAFLMLTFVLPTFLYFLNLYRKYKMTDFESFDAYFSSIQPKDV